MPPWLAFCVWKTHARAICSLPLQLRNTNVPVCLSQKFGAFGLRWRLRDWAMLGTLARRLGLLSKPRRGLLGTPERLRRPLGRSWGLPGGLSSLSGMARTALEASWESLEASQTALEASWDGLVPSRTALQASRGAA